MSWMASDLTYYRLDEEVKVERCKGAYPKVHSEAAPSCELAWRSWQPPPLQWREVHPSVWRMCEHSHHCLDTCLTADTTALFSGEEQDFLFGGGQLGDILWKCTLWETSLDCQEAAL